MHLTVDTASPVPPYEQVRAGIAGLVAAGELPPGTRLPTVRALAAELGLAVNTVARAYRELEVATLVETRGRQGSFVSASGDARERAALEAARDHARRSRALGLGLDDAVDRLRRVWDAGGGS